jgi:hypothetical protein
MALGRRRRKGECEYGAEGSGPEQSTYCCRIEREFGFLARATAFA